jgi:hypothetical protein
MKFTPDHDLDAKRMLFKIQYDLAFAEIRKHPVGSPERAELNREELRLHRRTWNFLKANAWYFSRKRRHIFDSLERKGVFGKRPDHDTSEYNKDEGSATNTRYAGFTRKHNGTIYKNSKAV